MIGTTRAVWAATALFALSILSACGDPAKAPAREHAEAEAAAAPAAEPEPQEYAAAEERSSSRGDDRPARDERPDPRDEPTPMLGDRPMWTATSRLTSEENAERAFRAHGSEFGSKDVDAYVRRAHAFLDQPPSDVLTLTRNNGDKLFYAPGDNVFAVAREDGAPRTLFKPEEGMAYWREQQSREQARAEGGGRRDRDERG